MACIFRSHKRKNKPKTLTSWGVKVKLMRQAFCPGYALNVFLTSFPGSEYILEFSPGSAFSFFYSENEYLEDSLVSWYHFYYYGYLHSVLHSPHLFCASFVLAILKVNSSVSCQPFLSVAPWLTCLLCLWSPGSAAVKRSSKSARCRRSDLTAERGKFSEQQNSLHK